MRQNSMQQVLFHFSRSTDNIKILSRYKKPWAIWKIALKKKKISQNISKYTNFFLELQCLVDYLVHFFRIINVYQFFFKYIIW